MGWEVWLDGMEVTQFTYFQQCGGIDCKPVSIEITYASSVGDVLQDVESIWDLSWNQTASTAISVALRKGNAITTSKP